MNSKFVIDYEVIESFGLTVPQFLFVLAVHKGLTPEMIENTVRHQRLVDRSVDGTFFPKKEAGPFIAKILAHTIADKKCTPKDAEDIAEALRDMFPTGKKQGTNNYWRGNRAEIRDRILIFLKKNGDFSKEDILKATKNYVDSFRGNYQLMRTLKYFIFKRNPDGSYEYDLLTYLENLTGNQRDSSTVETTRLV